LANNTLKYSYISVTSFLDLPKTVRVNFPRSRQPILKGTNPFPVSGLKNKCPYNLLSSLNELAFVFIFVE